MPHVPFGSLSLFPLVGCCLASLLISVVFIICTFLVKLPILPEFLQPWPATLVGFLVTQVGSLFRKLFPTPHQINEVNSVLAVYNAVYSISDSVLSKCLSCWKSFHCRGSAPVLKSLVIYQPEVNILSSNSPVKKPIYWCIMLKVFVYLRPPSLFLSLDPRLTRQCSREIRAIPRVLLWKGKGKIW